MCVRPFSPSEAWQFPRPPAHAHVHGEAEREAERDLINLRTPTLGSEESAGAGSADGSIGAHFARVETIRRPFAPALPDEMAVAPGERVRMLRRFDDGWAEAVKLGADPAAGAVACGLIPIDCLRMPGEELPAFLAAKRLSSYRGARSPSPGLREWEGEDMGMWEAV
ncbi:hypothetical protein WOLCODRAFT_67614 [Wolfiporia cocos MD-104 SS10]|uniref:SH3 domain-containing protein n=1 Tax=Wolfiporia cocos (strain MD-104) TaxID=742152 RepID=A0A2H3JN76_WOLCO|nr:hypothetical protein WOLCODRAFT_67614 [Wolfiporia cocos MD-104 SS10]